MNNEQNYKHYELRRNTCHQVISNYYLPLSCYNIRLTEDEFLKSFTFKVLKSITEQASNDYVNILWEKYNKSDD